MLVIKSYQLFIKYVYSMRKYATVHWRRTGGGGAGGRRGDGTPLVGTCRPNILAGPVNGFGFCGERICI